MMLYTNYESSGPCSFRQEDFWKLHFKNRFLTLWPTYATNQNHLNNFRRGPPGTIPVQFGQIPISGSREDVVCSFPYIIQFKIVTPGAGSISTPGGIIWTTLVEDLKMKLYTKYESSGPCSFRQEDFWKLQFENLFFDPVIYFCNQLEQFEQLW